MLFEGSYHRELASGGALIPSIEAGLRHDGGDGTTGTGFEIGAGLGYQVGRLSITIDSQSLLTHSDADEYSEWGVRGMVSYQPNKSGKGLSMSFGSLWGQSYGAAMAPTESIPSARDASESGMPRNPQSPRFHAEVQYDFRRLEGLKLWYSYRSSNTVSGFESLLVGLQFSPSTSFDAGLEFGRQENFNNPSRHTNSVELRGILRW